MGKSTISMVIFNSYGHATIFHTAEALPASNCQVQEMGPF